MGCQIVLKHPGGRSDLERLRQSLIVLKIHIDTVSKINIICYYMTINSCNLLSEGLIFLYESIEEGLFKISY